MLLKKYTYRPRDSNAIAIYDEFKIYKGALSFCNLINEFNYNGDK
jgi:hypothetical protein